jgi:hypothetical protein
MDEFRAFVAQITRRPGAPFPRKRYERIVKKATQEEARWMILALLAELAELDEQQRELERSGLL